MLKNILIIGARGHGKEIAQIIHDLNLKAPFFKILGFIDDDKGLKWVNVLEHKVLGTRKEIITNTEESVNFAMGIGDPLKKKDIVIGISLGQDRWPCLVHPSVRMTDSIGFEEGTIIFPGVVLSTDINLGKHVCINTLTSISHDVTVGDYSTINPGCMINGHVEIGACTYIGSGAIVKDEVRIGEGAIIGAGAVVIEDVEARTTVAGVPAREIHKG